MHALVIHQPWAWAILEGIKTIENRTWTTRRRGPLAIVAGRSKASLADGCEFLADLDPVDDTPSIVIPKRFDFGAIVGVVKLVDVVGVDDLAYPEDPFASGPYCWVLQNPVKLAEPIPVAGRLGLFPLPEPIAQQLHAACGTHSDSEPLPTPAVKVKAVPVPKTAPEPASTPHPTAPAQPALSDREIARLSLTGTSFKELTARTGLSKDAIEALCIRYKTAAYY